MNENQPPPDPGQLPDCVRCGAPWAEHAQGQCPRPPLGSQPPPFGHRPDCTCWQCVRWRWGERRVQRASRRHVSPPLTIGGVILAVLLALGIWHVVSNFASRSNPPVCVQLIGGTWSWWDGWQCGASNGGDPAPAQTTTTEEGNLPPGVTQDTNPADPPGSYVVDCNIGQCTSLPGAGPFGTTCGPISAGNQICSP